MSKEVSAVLFDLDGTLVNTLHSLRDTMNKTMEHFGLDPITEEQTKKYVGNGYQVFVEKSMQASADRLYREAEKWEKKDEEKALDLDQRADEVMADFDDACAYYVSVFRENCTYQVEAYPGIKDCLDILKNYGVKLACITNKSMEAAKTVLHHVFGENCFDYISADDGTHPLKPDTGVVKDACERLGVRVENCIFVGDTKTDMETARRAGMDSVGCIYGFRGRRELEESGASICVERATEILTAIRSIREISENPVER